MGSPPLNPQQRAFLSELLAASKRTCRGLDKITIRSEIRNEPCSDVNGILLWNISISSHGHQVPAFNHLNPLQLWDYELSSRQDKTNSIKWK